MLRSGVRPNFINTIHATVDANNPDSAVVGQAAEILRQGGLVAFPTETVYGLGVNAQDAEAVARVYQVKGRPSDNPLIWHGNSLGAFENVVSEIAVAAQKLADIFWPGPLTLVLPRPSGQTLAIRVPSHPVTRAIIAASGCLIAAPSANISGRPSPTKAKHVMEDLDGAIEMIIDGGSAQNGLESTVVDLHTGKPRLLRPGAVTLEMLQDVLGEVECPQPSDDLKESAPLSPGMKYRHYAPKAPLILVVGGDSAAVSDIAESYTAKGQKIGVLATSQYLLDDIAHILFDRLRQFDEDGVSTIIAEGVKEEGIGLAIMNRLKKAAAEVITL